MHNSAGVGTVFLLLMQICIAYAASYAQFGQCIFQLENLFLISLAVEVTPQWQNFSSVLQKHHFFLQNKVKFTN